MIAVVYVLIGVMVGVGFMLLLNVYKKILHTDIVKLRWKHGGFRII